MRNMLMMCSDGLERTQILSNCANYEQIIENTTDVECLIGVKLPSRPPHPSRDGAIQHGGGDPQGRQNMDSPAGRDIVIDHLTIKVYDVKGVCGQILVPNTLQILRKVYGGGLIKNLYMYMGIGRKGQNSVKSRVR